MSLAIQIENLSKQYRLGVVGTGTLSHDLNRWFANLIGKEDPYLQIGEVNRRDEAGGGYVWALRNIDLEVKEGEVLGIIGKNGAGKSTLLKILSKVTGPTTGTVKAKGRIASLLEVGTGFHPELTGRENIFLNGAILGMSKAEIRSKLEEIIEFSGVVKYVDTPVKRYSSGMKVRLGFAVAAHLEPEILVIDEVLAVGDADFQNKCIGKMQDVASTGRTILFVSHNMGAISELCNRAILLEDGCKVYEGESNGVVQRYLQSNDNQKNPINIKSNDNAPFRLKKIGIQDSKNTYKSEYDIYEPVKIQIVIEAKEQLENFHLKLQLFKGPTFLFFTQFSDDFREGLNLNKGHHTISYKIPAKTLKSDNYSVTLIGTYQGGRAGIFRQEKHEHVVSFNILEASENVDKFGYSKRRKGLIIAPGKWELE